VGEMKKANARENEERQRDRFSSTLVIAAAIIAAVRWLGMTSAGPARGSSPIADSVGLARMILKRVVER
jgi:hypothetical protein